MPEESVELCTISGVTYVSVPDDSELPIDQPAEISDTIETVVMTDEIRELISEHSSHVWLIDQRVRELIAAKYSITDEIKQMRQSPSSEFNEYNAHVEACRAWGHAQKAELGLNDA